MQNLATVVEARKALWTAGMVGLATLGVFLIVGTYSRDANITSDDLASVDFCDDILHGADLSAWHLPPAPYLVPDVLILLPCRVLIHDLILLFLAYDCVFYGLILLGLAWIGRGAGLTWREAIPAAALGVTLLMGINLDPCNLSGSPHLVRARELVHPGSHLGVICAGLLLTGFLLQGIRGGFRPVWFVIAVFLGGAAAFSDRLLFVQFLGPVAATVTILRSAGVLTNRQTLLTAGLLAGIVGSFYCCQRMIAQQGMRMHNLDSYLYLTTLHELRTHLRDLWSYLKFEYVQCFVMPIAILVVLVASGSAWVRVMKGVGSETLCSPLMMFFSMCSGIVPLLTLGHAPGEGFERYLYTLTVLPPLIVPLFVRVALKPLPQQWAPAIQGLIVLIVLWQFGSELNRHGLPRFQQPYPEMARVLDQMAREQGCRYGLAGYWDARQLRFLTHERVVVMPAAHGGSPFIHGCNPDTFLSKDPRDLCVPKYQFIIVSKHDFWLPAEAVRNEIGPPSSCRIVGDQEIWIYDKLDSPNWNGFLNSLLARRLERTVQPIPLASPHCLGTAKDGFANDRTLGQLLSVLPGSETQVTFPSVIHARFVDISADHNQAFGVSFFARDQCLGTVQVRPVLWIGDPGASPYGAPRVRSRIVEIPSGIATRGWDRAVVKQMAHDQPAVLAHFLAFPPEVERKMRPASVTVVPEGDVAPPSEAGSLPH